MQEIINLLLKIEKQKLFYLIIYSIYIKKNNISLNKVKGIDIEVYNFVSFLKRNNLFSIYFLKKILSYIKLVYIEKDSRIELDLEGDLIYKKDKKLTLYVKEGDKIYKRSLENDLFKLLG